MLRLPTTKLELGNRDMAWHKHRFELRKFEFEYYMRTGQFCLPEQRSRRVGNPFQSLSGNDAPFSKQSVPQHSDKFWAAVLKHATSPPKSLSSYHYRRHCEQTTGSFSSFRSHAVRNQTTWKGKVNIDEANQPLRSRNNKQRNRLLSSSSSNNTSPTDRKDYELEPTINLNNFSREHSPEEVHTKSLEKATLQSSRTEADLLDVQEQLASRLNFDGIQDEISLCNQHDFSQVPSPDLADIGYSHSLTSEGNGLKHPKRPTPSKQQNTRHAKPYTDYEEPLPYVAIDNKSSESPHLRQTLSKIDRLRKCSGALPPSPLCIFQAARSSSPDKQRGQLQDHLGFGKDGWRSHYVPSDLGEESSNPEHERSDNHLEDFNDALSFWSIDEAEDEVLYSQQESSDRQRLEGFSPLSASDIHASIDSASTEESISFMSERSVIYLTPPSDLPCTSSHTTAAENAQALPTKETPSPRTPCRRVKKASSHTISFDLSFPPATPNLENDIPMQNEPRIDTPIDISSLVLLPMTTAQRVRAERDTRLSLPSSLPALPNIQRTPASSIRVYDDSLLAEPQPQTPFGLPRHGVPPMPMDGIFNAPESSASIRVSRPVQCRERGSLVGTLEGNDGRSGWPQQMGSENTFEQENVPGETRWERQQRILDRRAMAGGRMDGILERTPPRDETNSH